MGGNRRIPKASKPEGESARKRVRRNNVGGDEGVASTSRGLRRKGAAEIGAACNEVNLGDEGAGGSNFDDKRKRDGLEWNIEESGSEEDDCEQMGPKRTRRTEMETEAGWYRETMVLQWVLDEQNTHRDDILERVALPELVKTLSGLP